MKQQSQGLAIVGLGVTAQGRVPDTAPEEMRIEGLRRAIDDAGISPREVDGYIYQQGVIDMNDFAPGGRAPKTLGMRPKLIWTLQGGGTSAIAAITAASGAIASGAAEVIAIGYGDTMLSYNRSALGQNRRVPNTSAAYGLFSPAADHAMAARRHMHEYGTTKEHLGAVALSARSYAAKRPEAYMHDRPLSMDEYLGARPVADPLGKYDCCLVADGGCAFIVTTVERAAEITDNAVRIGGVGFSHTVASGFDRTQYVRSNIGQARDDAFAGAGVTFDDIDVAQVYDCFTSEVLMALEGLGFCGEGESGPYASEGNLGLDGPVPVNTAGGELAWSYMQGFTPVVEGIRQLRGEGGETQVDGARTCLVTGHGMVSPSTGHGEYADAVMILTTGD